MTASLMALTASDALTIVNNFLLLFGGIAAFIIGMNMMGTNLEKAAGRHMRRLMAKATKNRFLGVGTGAAVTAIVTSSSATTVMIVGFVNVGLMTLTQAVSVIMGANIGTTITAFITAISTTGGTLEITSVFACLAFAGVLMNMLGKKDIIKYVGLILAGLGLIFIGMNTMSVSMGELMAEKVISHDATGEAILVDNPIASFVKGMFSAIGGTANGNLPWQIPVLFLLGAVLTGLVQSSAAVTAIVMSLARAEAVDLPFAMFVILGTNVGTCVTALLSSLGTNVNARRTAFVHFSFNIIGGIIFMIPLAFPFVSNGIATVLQSVTDVIAIQIALFHMFFNIVTTLILLPFQNMLVKLAMFVVRDKKGAAVQGAGEEDETLDYRLLKTPAIAIGQARKQIVKMGNLAFENYKLSLEMLLSGDLSKAEDFAEREKHINEYNHYINSYLVKLSLEPLSQTDEKKLSSFYHVTSDLERIGDYAENIVEYAQTAVKDKIVFSEHALEEIREMDSHLTELYKYVKMSFERINLSYLRNIDIEEQATDKLCVQMQQSHLRRLTENRCTAEAGAIFLQLAINMERIGDHMKNISNSVKDYAPPVKQ